MRLLLILSLIALSFILHAQPGNGETLAAEGLKPFSHEHGTIAYQIVEGGEGKVELKFDLYGMLTASHHQISFTLYGMETSMDELTIRDGDHQYIYDLIKQKGRTKSNKTQSDLLRYKSPKETREAIHTVNNGQMVGLETIMDKPAEHWVFESGPYMELWTWEGITLKAKVKRPKVTYTYVATNIDLNRPLIKYPEGIVISQE